METVWKAGHCSESTRAVAAASLEAARLLLCPGKRLIRQLMRLRRFLQHPLMTVGGMLIAGGAAKTGYGGLAAGVVLTSILVDFSALATAMLTRRLQAWITCMQRFEHNSVLRRSRASSP